jgi:hypothetical protein
VWDSGTEDMQTYSRFQVDENGSRDVACIVGLVEEDVLAITTFGRKVLEVAILTDTMFLT